MKNKNLHIGNKSAFFGKIKLILCIGNKSEFLVLKNTFERD